MKTTSEPAQFDNLEVVEMSVMLASCQLKVCNIVADKIIWTNLLKW